MLFSCTNVYNHTGCIQKSQFSRLTKNICPPQKNIVGYDMEIPIDRPPKTDLTPPQRSAVGSSAGGKEYRRGSQKRSESADLQKVGACLDAAVSQRLHSGVVIGIADDHGGSGADSPSSQRSFSRSRVAFERSVIASISSTKRV